MIEVLIGLAFGFAWFCVLSFFLLFDVEGWVEWRRMSASERKSYADVVFWEFQRKRGDDFA